MQQVISITTLINLVHTCLFHKGLCTVYFVDKKGNTVTIPHMAQRKHAFLVKTKDMSKSNKIAPRNKGASGLLHHRFGRICTRSFIDGYTANFWKDI